MKKILIQVLCLLSCSIYLSAQNLTISEVIAMRNAKVEVIDSLMKDKGYVKKIAS